MGKAIMIVLPHFFYLKILYCSFSLLNFMPEGCKENEPAGQLDCSAKEKPPEALSSICEDSLCFSKRTGAADNL
jgi:hypothetical protein